MTDPALEAVADEFREAAIRRRRAKWPPPREEFDKFKGYRDPETDPIWEPDAT
jgi:hypothetical protein